MLGRDFAYREPLSRPLTRTHTHTSSAEVFIDNVTDGSTKKRRVLAPVEEWKSAGSVLEDFFSPGMVEEL